MGHLVLGAWKFVEIPHQPRSLVPFVLVKEVDEPF